MKAREISIGEHYIARVSNRLVVVYVTGMHPGGRFSVVNLNTGRNVVFKTAAKFRRVATPAEINQTWVML